jgi:hypothetical protein
LDCISFWSLRNFSSIGAVGAGDSEAGVEASAAAGSEARGGAAYKDRGWAAEAARADPSSAKANAERTKVI